MAITRYWKLDKAPNLSEGIASINLTYEYKKCLAIHSDRLDKFQKAWQPWLP